MAIKLKAKRIKVPDVCNQRQVAEHAQYLQRLRALLGHDRKRERELVWFLCENRAKTGEWMLAPFETLEDLRLCWLRAIVQHWDKGWPRIEAWLKENPLEGDWL